MSLPLHVIDDILYAAELSIDTRVAFKVPPKKIVVCEDLKTKLNKHNTRRAMFFAKQKKLAAENAGYFCFLENFSVTIPTEEEHIKHVIAIEIDSQRNYENGEIIGDILIQISVGIENEIEQELEYIRQTCYNLNNGSEAPLLIDNMDDEY